MAQTHTNGNPANRNGRARLKAGNKANRKHG